MNRHRLSLIGLLEMKDKVINERQSQMSFFATRKYVVVYDDNGVGTMQVYLDPTRVIVDVIDTAPQWIHTKATFLESDVSFSTTFVYGLHLRGVLCGTSSARSLGLVTFLGAWSET